MLRRTEIRKLMKTCSKCDGTGKVYDRVKLGAKLSEFRKLMGVQAKDVAVKLGESASYLNLMERGGVPWTEQRVENYIKAVEELK